MLSGPVCVCVSGFSASVVCSHLPPLVPFSHLVIIATE